MTTTKHAVKGEASVEVNVPLRLALADLEGAIAYGMIGGPHGYAYWCDGVEFKAGDKRAIPTRATECRDEWLAKNVLAGGTVTVIENEDEWNADRRGMKRHTLTREKLLVGFGRWVAEFGPKGQYDEATGITHFDVDAPASDAIMQFAVLGKQVYG